MVSNVCLWPDILVYLCMEFMLFWLHFINKVLDRIITVTLWKNQASYVLVII